MDCKECKYLKLLMIDSNGCKINVCTNEKSNKYGKNIEDDNLMKINSNKNCNIDKDK